MLFCLYQTNNSEMVDLLTYFELYPVLTIFQDASPKPHGRRFCAIPLNNFNYMQKYLKSKIIIRESLAQFICNHDS